MTSLAINGVSVITRLQFATPKQAVKLGSANVASKEADKTDLDFGFTIDTKLHEVLKAISHKFVRPQEYKFRALPYRS